jgi:hypothetical protein
MNFLRPVGVMMLPCRYLMPPNVRVAAPYAGRSALKASAINALLGSTFPKPFFKVVPEVPVRRISKFADVSS